MIKNYFRIAVRNLLKNKISTCINLLSLVLGMTCCIVILAYIRDEISFNKFHSKSNDIFLVNWTSKTGGRTSLSATTPVALQPVIKTDIPQILNSTRLYQRSGQIENLTVQDKTSNPGRHQEQNIYFTDNDLFHIFSIHFTEGDSARALTGINSVVITSEMARKYFGTTRAQGRLLFYDNKTLLQVTGVVEKMPDNSDLQFDFLISFETLFNIENAAMAGFLRTDWTYNPAYTYILVKSGQQPGRIDDQLNGLIKKYGNIRAREMNNLSLQPLRRIHLFAGSVIGNPSTSSIGYIYIFSGIALLILIIANVNFINLTTARFVTRTSEVGIRKVLGAGRRQLMTQFLSESLLLCLVSFVLACCLSLYGLTLLNVLTGKHITWSELFSPPNILFFVVIFLSSGILSGLYPALLAARFKPALSLKGKSGESVHRNIIRQVLMVAQFCISVILITGAIIIYQQLQYLRNKPLGFKKNEIIVVPIFGSGASSIDYGVDAPTRQKMNRFASELKQSSRILDVTAASALPGQGYVRGLIIPEGSTEKDNIFVPWVSVDYNFNQAMQIPLIAGRDFSKNTGTDHLSAFILNESAVRSLGWKSPDAAIGRKMVRGDEKNGKQGLVIGVVRDFNFNTLDQAQEPMIMDVNAPRFTQFAISVKPDHMSSTIEHIKQEWNSIFPERVFEYSFLDKDISALYNSQENLGKMIEYFALIAIALSCMGLFSLSSFLAVQRTKEIGIRKVLGASIADILGMLCWHFLRWVIIGLLIAIPVSWYIMNSWLAGYAYRITISWWIFLLPACLTAFVALATIISNVMNTALTNPAKVLRAE